MAQITLYTSPGCHLCKQARDVLIEIRRDHPFELVERDITGDEAAHRSYFERIPVIALDGKELFDFFVDERELRARLAGLH